MDKCEVCGEHKPMGGTYEVGEDGEVTEVTIQPCDECYADAEDRRHTDRAAGMMWH